jgi:hypothetical protein
MVLSNMEFCCSFSCSWLIRCSYILLICCSNKRASFYMFSHFLKMTFIVVGTWVVLVVSFLLDIAQMLLILVIFELVTCGTCISKSSTIFDISSYSNKFQDELLWSKLFLNSKILFKKITNNFDVFNQFPKIKLWR